MDFVQDDHWNSEEKKDAKMSNNGILGGVLVGDKELRKVRPTAKGTTRLTVLKKSGGERCGTMDCGGRGGGVILWHILYTVRRV